MYSVIDTQYKRNRFNSRKIQHTIYFWEIFDSKKRVKPLRNIWDQDWTKS